MKTTKADKRSTTDKTESGLQRFSLLPEKALVTASTGDGSTAYIRLGYGLAGVLVETSCGDRA